MRITEKLLDDTVAATAEMLTFRQAADTVLSNVFRARHTGSQERAFVANTAYAVLRRKRWLEALIGDSGAATPLHLVLACLVRLLGVSQRQLADAIPDDRLMAWVSALKARPEPALSLGEQTDFPDWLVARLSARLSEAELLTLARSLNQSAPLDLRVNTLKANREAVIGQLAAEGLHAEPCPYAPAGIRLKTKPALARHPLFLNGEIEVQDEGSQLLGYLLGPKRGEMVVDFCAGAGGKTLLLGAMMRSTGRLYAFEVAEKRLAKMKPRLARAGLSNVHPVRITSEQDIHVKRLAGKIDRVLVDAPCSGLGTLRRNPDLKWRQTEASIAELVRKQADILASASRLVKVGGRLVYATCSILPEENEAIVSAFLDSYPDFSVLSAQEILAGQGITIDTGEFLRLSPHIHQTDGFFAAALIRR